MRPDKFPADTRDPPEGSNMDNRTKTNTPFVPDLALPQTLGVIVTALLGLAPAGTALGTALLRTALGRAAGLPLATLLGGRLPARRTSLGRHGSIQSETTREAQLRSKPGGNTTTNDSY